MIEVYLYGKLRRFTDNQDPSRDSIVHVPTEDGDTIEDIVSRIGIPFEELGSNIFLNGRLFPLEMKAKAGDRLGIFPDDMQMIIV
jgi:molybdopterin converting factor small subunit